MESLATLVCADCTARLCIFHARLLSTSIVKQMPVFLLVRKPKTRALKVDHKKKKSCGKLLLNHKDLEKTCEHILQAILLCLVDTYLKLGPAVAPHLERLGLGGTQLLQLVESCRWADCPGREAFTLSHSSLTISMFANKLDILIIANGRPPHFFSILFETCFSTSGQRSSEPNILLKNNVSDCKSLRASISYMRPLPSREHDLATSTMRVVAIILLEKSFSGKAFLIAFQADFDHISSITNRYLKDISRYY